jgi:tRNA A-37 threonylcarbamoyl transferase component Bud32
MEAIERIASGARWLLRPECAPHLDSLFGPSGLRLDEWLAAGSATILKQAPHRTLYRVVLPGLDFHLKHYPIVGRRGWLRGLLRSSNAQLEYHRTQALIVRGVPTCEPLAVGESQPGGPQASYLITRTLPDTVPLNLFLDDLPQDWSADRRARFRQRLARALGRFLAALHDAGVTHQDLHPGNILLQLGPEDKPRLYLIDTLMVHLGSPLTHRAARDNLVILNRWFMLRSQYTDRLRFWHAYMTARTGGLVESDPHSVWAAVRDLERRTLQSNLCFWRSHDDRCVENNRWFRRFRIGNMVGHAVADLDEAALAPLLSGHDAFVRQPGARTLKESPTCTVVAFTLATAAGPLKVVGKRLSSRPWRRWAAMVRPTQALRSYILGHGLRLRCLPTPRPLAVWHDCRGGLPGDAYLLTETVPGAVDLKAFVERLAHVPPAERLRRLRCVIDQAGRLVRLLHQRLLSHRDLKAANLLVSPTPPRITSRGIAPLGGAPPDGGDHLWLIDLVGVRRHARLPRGRKVRDLARLHASFRNHPGLTRTDKLRFLRIYLRWGLCGRQGWKRWWQEIAVATCEKVQKNLRNRRPLG